MRDKIKKKIYDLLCPDCATCELAKLNECPGADYCIDYQYWILDDVYIDIVVDEIVEIKNEG